MFLGDFSEHKNMRTDLIELKKFLEAEFTSKKQNNSSYSKNAFSRDIGISSTALNDFLAGKRDLSFKNVDKVFKYLNKKVHCSWCDQPQKEVKYLIGGPRRQFICNQCIDRCLGIAKNREMMRE